MSDSLAPFKKFKIESLPADLANKLDCVTLLLHEQQAFARKRAFSRDMAMKIGKWYPSAMLGWAALAVPLALWLGPIATPFYLLATAVVMIVAMGLSGMLDQDWQNISPITKVGVGLAAVLAGFATFPFLAIGLFAYHVVRSELIPDEVRGKRPLGLQAVLAVVRGVYFFFADKELAPSLEVSHVSLGGRKPGKFLLEDDRYKLFRSLLEGLESWNRQVKFLAGLQDQLELGLIEKDTDRQKVKDFLVACRADQEWLESQVEYARRRACEGEFGQQSVRSHSAIDMVHEMAERMDRMRDRRREIEEATGFTIASLEVAKVRA
ncbi:MAG: hypothetical protein ABIA47_00400 [bacterium]